MKGRSRSNRLTIFMLLALIVTGCDSQTLAPTPTPSLTNNIEQPTSTLALPASPTATLSTPLSPTTPSTNTALPTIPSPTPDPVQAPSSLDNIAVALETGRINAETALIYQLYAQYLPDKLPSEYKGDDSGPFPEPTLLFSSLQQRLSNLPAASRTEIAPFFLRPDNPDSFWSNLAAQSATFPGRAPGLAIMAAPNFAHKDTTYIRVWYDSNNAAVTQKASQIAAEIERSKMWDKEKATMLNREPCTDKDLPLNGGDGKLDVYLVPQATRVRRVDTSGQEVEPAHSMLAGSEGLAVPLGPVGACPNASFLLVDVTRALPDLRSTLAHELFHAFQFSYKKAGLNSEYGWWIEGSAAWAEDLVYPTNVPDDDVEWGYLHHNWAFRSNYDGPLDAYRDLRSGPADYPQYAAYLWAFYLRQKANGDETIIGEMWKRSEAEIPLKVMRNTGDWSERFKEFALWNWNREPVQNYVDSGRSISALGQNPVSEVLAMNHPTYTDDLDLPRVSARYYMFDVTDLGEQGTYGFVNQLQFNFAGLSSQPDLGIQAIIQSGTNTQLPKGYRIEDWSGESKHIICREVDPVSRVVLVVSNSAIEDPAKGPLKVEALNKDCPKQANFSFTQSGAYSFSTSDPLQEQGSADIRQNLSSSWDIAFLEHKDIEQSTRYTDITRYVFTATNTYDVSLGGAYNSTGPFDTITANLTGGGTYETHNPPLPDEDEYKYMSQYSGPNSADVLATRRGTIETYKDRDGVYQSIISFDPATVALEYQVSRHQTRNCPPNESATYDETTNEKGVNAVAQGSNDCLNSGPTLSSHKFERPTPDLYGTQSFTPDSKNPGNWQIKPFDPKVGIIEGQLDFTVTTCDLATQVDTLHLFATLLPAISRYTSTASQCNLTAHAQYQVKLPPRTP